MNGTSQRFYGKWPEGHRTVKDMTPKPVVGVTPKRKFTKPQVSGIVPERNLDRSVISLEEGN